MTAVPVVSRLVRWKTPEAKSAPADLTSSWLVRLSALYGLITYADYFNLLGYSSIGIGNISKYILFLALIVSFVLHLARAKRVRIGWNAPTIFLGFTIIAAIPFVVQLITRQPLNSYISAFVASIIFSTSIVFEREKYKFDPNSMCLFLLKWLTALSCLYVGELLVRRYSNLSYFSLLINQTNHLKSVVFIAGLSLAIMSKQGSRWTISILILIVFSLLLRPSSTLLLAMSFCIPIAFLIRMEAYRSAERICYGVIAAAMATPFLLYHSQAAGLVISSIEAFVKTDTFNGISDTPVRLAMIDLALDRLNSSSWIVGDMFSGGTSVLVASALPFWLQNFVTGAGAIHSDYVILLVEGGLVGYAFFNLAMFFIVRSHFRRLKALYASNSSLALRALAALACPVTVMLVIYCSANPLLQSYQVAFVAWFVLLTSEISIQSSQVAFRALPKVAQLFSRST